MAKWNQKIDKQYLIERQDLASFHLFPNHQAKKKKKNFSFFSNLLKKNF